MSSLLLTNPFATPSSINSTPLSLPSLAVAPAQDASAPQDQDDATSFGGSGAGGSNQGSTAALMRMHANTARPHSEASPASVIKAQAVPEPAPIVVSNTLPEVEMPDPLPTSPFLIRD